MMKNRSFSPLLFLNHSDGKTELYFLELIHFSGNELSKSYVDVSGRR